MLDFKAVIGANYGDEGKGLMTDYFAGQEKKSLGVLVNGGPQRGHTVTTPDGRSHVFHHFSAGTFAGADTYCSEFFYINPMEWKREIDELGFAPKLILDPKCEITTPYDMMINQMHEECETGGYGYGYSSCGYGIWETKKRIAQGVRCNFISIFKAGYGIFLKDHIREAVKNVRQYYLKLFPDMPPRWRTLFLSDSLLEHFVDDTYKMRLKCQIRELVDIISEYERVIFELGQGLRLDEKCDKDHGTPSATGVENVMDLLSNVTEDWALEVCYVTRSYLTRHGSGLFTGDKNDELAKLVAELDTTNSPNEHQGTLRVGTFDLMTWVYALDRMHEDFERTKVVSRAFERVYNIEIRCKMSIAATWCDKWDLDEEVDYKVFGKTRDDVKRC